MSPARAHAEDSSSAGYSWLREAMHHLIDSRWPSMLCLLFSEAMLVHRVCVPQSSSLPALGMDTSLSGIADGSYRGRNLQTHLPKRLGPAKSELKKCAFKCEIQWVCKYIFLKSFFFPSVWLLCLFLN